MTNHPIELKNTASHSNKAEPFVPLDWQDDTIPEKDKKVRMYVCGPTVYDRAHIGNARPVVVFDVLYRLLRHVYGEDHVTYARNFTDVDDKINAKAEQTGRSIRDITDETIGWFLDDMGALGALQPNEAPRATEYIPQMIAMIEELIAKGHAYEAEGHALFDVNSYAAYGALSGRSVDDMIAGARVEVAPYKRNPMDFVLWKPSSGIQPGWDSPWGYGRPGWHIECSAMSRALFGVTFDIHGGGLDLQFPHHENEIAQSCACCGEDTFAKVWMHNEMLQVEGKKMSKSLGNFFSVRELLDKGYPGEVIRFVFLSTHYSKPMDWTDKKAREAEATLRKWAVFARGIPASQVDKRVIEALASDLNTHGAITVLHKIFAEKDAGKLRASAQMLGLMDDIDEGWLNTPEFENIVDEIVQLVEPLLDELNAARGEKNYEKSDKIRDGLVALGVKPMTDKKSGRAVWHYTLQDPARARDIDAPKEGFLGASVYIAGWLKEGLENLKEEVL